MHAVRATAAAGLMPTKDQLKASLRDRGLAVGGTKPELALRLAAAGSGQAGITQGERDKGFRGRSLEPLDLFKALLTHLHTVCMACSECLPTRLNPLAR